MAEEDVDDFFEYASVDGVGEMAGWKHHETLKPPVKSCMVLSAKKCIRGG